MTTLTLTQSKDGGYRFHRDTCKKIEGRPTYTPAEVAEDDLDALTAATAASCCKPSRESVLEVKQEFDVDSDHTGDDTPEAEAAEDEVVTEGDTSEDDDLLDVEPEDDTEASDTNTEEADMVTDDEDLLGDAPVQTVKPKKAKATPGTPQRSQEGREMDVVLALADILGIEVADGIKFPGHGKAIKVKGGGSIYLNSKHYADVRAKDLETARGWVQDGLGTARGGNYVRVSVEGL